HPLITEAMDEIKAGEKLSPLVDSIQAGAAEVLFGLGTSLGRQGGEDLALAYLQLAVYLAPRHPLALMSLADLYEQLKKSQLAINIYQRVPAESAEGELGPVLFPRHLLRALQAVGQGRGRLQEVAGPVPGAAARAQLSRLFLDRPGHQPR